MPSWVDPSTTAWEKGLVKCYKGLVKCEKSGPTLVDAGTNARPRRGAPLSSDFMVSSRLVNRVTIVVERRYTVQH